MAGKVCLLMLVWHCSSLSCYCHSVQWWLDDRKGIWPAKNPAPLISKGSVLEQVQSAQFVLLQYKFKIGLYHFMQSQQIL